jgi:hypothetical protein
LKHKRLFSILAVAVVLSLLMVAIPVIPVTSAVPMITLSVAKGAVGDKITVTGSGFTPNPLSGGHQAYDVFIYFSSQAATVDGNLGPYSNYDVNIYKCVKQYVYTDANGGFSKFFDVPTVLDDGTESAEVQGGTYYVYVTYEGQDTIKAYAEFTVVGITRLSPDSGPVGTTVEMDGIGFDGGNVITMNYDGKEVSVAGGDKKVKTNGTFTSRMDIPVSTAGEHTITVEDEGGNSGSVQFTVEPAITLNPASASAGEEVTINGTGFGVLVGLFVYFAGNEVYILGDNATDGSGSFESSFLVPSDVSPGSYDVEAEDDDGNTADIELEVGPGLTTSPVTSLASPANIGDTIELSGTGFLPNHEITITYSSNPEETFTTTSLPDGSFTYSFTVPPGTGGEHTINATDGTSTKEINFFVESTPPPVPTPELPAMDTKASSKTEFDWSDVTDPSLPISYELQVATNSQFTSDSIVVSKIGLATSNYTLSDDEKLQSTGADAPYYWRVRARDAASNPSEWSSGVRFTVGSSFHMPGWLLYVLIAIGVVGVFFLGLWLGRRSAISEDYYY